MLFLNRAGYIRFYSSQHSGKRPWRNHRKTGCFSSLFFRLYVNKESTLFQPAFRKTDCLGVSKSSRTMEFMRLI